MKDVADDLRAEVRRATEQLRGLSEPAAVAFRGDGKWTRKEILGHLVDSAANNHQRFVRVQVENPFLWPGYEQDAWVACQRSVESAATHRPASNGGCEITCGTCDITSGRSSAARGLDAPTRRVAR
jgi:hypothetical protein